MAAGGRPGVRWLDGGAARVVPRGRARGRAAPRAGARGGRAAPPPDGRAAGRGPGALRGRGVPDVRGGARAGRGGVRGGVPARSYSWRQKIDLNYWAREYVGNRHGRCCLFGQER